MAAVRIRSPDRGNGRCNYYFFPSVLGLEFGLRQLQRVSPEYTMRLIATAANLVRFWGDAAYILGYGIEGTEKMRRRPKK